MRDIYSKAYDYIINDQDIIDLIESDTAQLEKDITAMWVAGYVRAELEKYTEEGTTKLDSFLEQLACDSIAITKTFSRSWSNFSIVKHYLIDAYKAGYNTRANE